MGTPRVHYETAPTLSIRNPLCNGCLTEVDHDGDGWYCARCGTTWEVDGREGEEGTLYEEWSGEPNPGVLRTLEEGHKSVEADPPSPLAKYLAKQGR